MASTKTGKKAGKSQSSQEKPVVQLPKVKKNASAGQEAQVKPLRRDAAQREAAKKKINFKEFITSARQFFTGVWQELKKVHWPSRREVVVYTGVVLVVVGIVMVIIWIADSIYSQILRMIIK